MHYLGLDIGGTKMEAALLSAQGDYLWRKRQPTHKESYAEFMLHLVSLIDDARAVSPETFTVGIGLPGAIDPQTRLIKNCNCLVLNGHDLKADLAARIHQQVWIANDADCFTLLSGRWRWCKG